MKPLCAASFPTPPFFDFMPRMLGNVDCKKVHFITLTEFFSFTKISMGDMCSVYSALPELITGSAIGCREAWMPVTKPHQQAGTTVLPVTAATDPAGSLTGKRLNEIMARVHEQGFVPIEALARNFEVTPQTIRRDINKLCKYG
jgi:hypothetical protein